MNDPEQKAEETSPPPLYQQWCSVTAALVMSYRVGPGVPFTRRQMDAYLFNVIGPVQGNREPGTGIAWGDVRKIVKRFARDLDEELKRLEREEE